MNDMIIRVTENKREVGILKKSSQQQALPIDTGNVGKGPEKSCNMNEKDVGLNKCFGKFPPDKGTKSEPDGDNNDDKRGVVKEFKDFVLNKNTGIGGEIPEQHIELMVKQVPIPMELADFDLELEMKSNSKHTTKTKEIRHFKEGKSESETYLKYPNTTRSDINKLTDDLNNSDSSDEESKQKHPNRRLELERSEVELPTKKSRYSCLAGKEEHKSVKRAKSTVVTIVNKQYRSDKTGKRPRGMTLTRVVIKEEMKTAKVGQVASKMWENVIDSPHLWEGETGNVKEQFDVKICTDDIDSGMNYNRMLNEFVFQRKKGNRRANGETLYEKRVKEMLRDANSRYILKEFYIPPALVELFYQKMVQGQAAVDSLREICELKKWPEPTFTCVSSVKGFLYSCTLKTETFVPTKTATNEELAKELAAVECLRWLGLEHRA